MPKVHTLFHNMTIVGDIGELVLSKIIYLSLARNNLDRYLLYIFEVNPFGKYIIEQFSFIESLFFILILLESKVQIGRS